jgi:hypothetical protein
MGMCTKTLSRAPGSLGTSDATILTQLTMKEHAAERNFQVTSRAPLASGFKRFSTCMTQGITHTSMCAHTHRATHRLRDRLRKRTPGPHTHTFAHFPE